MSASIILTVGLGSDQTIVTGVIADGSVVCNIVMNKQQTQDHIALLQRHLDALGMMPTEHSVAIN
jgi:hypothetical protein